MTMSDITVESSASAATEARHRRMLVWTTTDIGYVIYQDNAAFIVYRKTIDGGTSWGAPVTIDSSDDDSWDIWFDKWTPGDTGTLIHIWWLDAGNHDIRYRTIDTNNDALGVIRVVFDGVSFSAVAFRDNGALSGVKARGGNLYFQFWGDSSGEHGFARSVNGGVTWTARTDGADSNIVDEVILLPDAVSAGFQDICMIYWDRTNNQLSLKKYDNSANSWTETLISAGMTDSNAVLQIDAVLRHSDGNIIVAAWNATDVVTADLQCWDIAVATPTITAKTNIVTNTDDCVCCALFIDQFTDDLYCAYLGNEDGSEVYQATLTVFYKKSTDGGGSWGAQTAYQENAADDMRAIQAGHSTPGAIVGRFEPVFFNDDLADLFVNKNNSVITGGGNGGGGGVGDKSQSLESSLARLAGINRGVAKEFSLGQLVGTSRISLESTLGRLAGMRGRTSAEFAAKILR